MRLSGEALDRCSRSVSSSSTDTGADLQILSPSFRLCVVSRPLHTVGIFLIDEQAPCPNVLFETDEIEATRASSCCGS